MEIIDEYRSLFNKCIKNGKQNFTLVADLRNFKTLLNDLVAKQKQSMEDFAKAGMFRI